MASDLISRDALIEELKEDVEFESPTFNQCVNSAMSSAFRIAIKRVKDAPAVDAVEVVRCKDCAHKRNEGSILRCPYSTVDLEPDGFCHRGER